MNFGNLGASFAPGAVELLLAKVGANTRLIVEETRKLATYAAPATVDKAPAPKPATP